MMSNGIHCDGPACDTWASPSMATNAGFLTVFDGVYPAYAELVVHFCSWDCALRYAAMQSPLDQVQLT